MDDELWAARYSAAKRHAGRSSMDRHMGIDDMKVDYDMRAEFTCTFCDLDFDIATLCRHLEDHHPFESSNAVCPVCAAKVGRDMVGHITLQHGHLFKVQRRRRFRKGVMPSNSTLSFLGKELREVQLHSLLGGAFSRSGGTSSNAASDPLLASLVYMLPKPETEEHPQPSLSTETCSTKDSPHLDNMTSAESSITAEEREQMFEEEVRRTEFAQQLVLSTFFGNDV
jgi:hypothetical protein